MDTLVQAMTLAAVLSSGLIGGVFFAFSSFVMRALARLPAAQGIAAMQSINVTVLCASFLVTFMGTALLSLGALALAIARWGQPGAALLAAGGILYVVGTFLVTGVCNVPLNDALGELEPGDARSVDVWESYVRRWTNWNHVRTAAAVLAAVAFTLAFREGRAG